MENYTDIHTRPGSAKEGGQFSESQHQWVQGVLKAEVHDSSFPDVSQKVPSLPILKTLDLVPTIDTDKSPSYWSKVCLRNIARLAKEATTVRRVLEPLFQNFDAANHWSPENRLAYHVLMYLQSLLEESGDNSHLLFSILVKHLDHKNVVKQPRLQTDIVNVTTQIAQSAKQQASVAIIGAISDLIKHLRKCLQNQAEVSNPTSTEKWNQDLQSALERCISQLSNKASSHMALVRCFQLAFSIRTLSLDRDGGLQESRRRSLYTLASYMLIFSARAGNFPELIPIVKASLTDQMVDPCLLLVDDIRLRAVSIDSNMEKLSSRSHEDEVAALKSHSAVELDEQLLKENVISHFMTKFAILSEDELSSIKKQLLLGFSPDDAFPLGAPLFMETPRPCSPLAQIDFADFDEVMPPGSLTDEEAFPEPSGSQSERKASLSISTFDILNVNQLLDSVLETAQQVASFPVSTTPVPYDQMKSQCEALVTGKQQKMAVLHSFKHQQETKALVLSSESENKSRVSLPMALESSEGHPKVKDEEQIEAKNQLLLCLREYGQHSFKLPPSSPYDKFLKAAGC